jgi:hypothetical protein
VANRWACRSKGGGFATYEAARLAGKLALEDFLERLVLEKSRIE